MRIEPTVFLVLLSASFVNASLRGSSSRSTSRIRGAVKYDNIDNRNQGANHNGRVLKATLGVAQGFDFDVDNEDLLTAAEDEDPNQRMQKNSEPRGAGERAKKNEKGEMPTVPESDQDDEIVNPIQRKRQGPHTGKLRSSKDKKARDAADKVYPTAPPKESPKEEKDPEETPKEIKAPEDPPPEESPKEEKETKETPQKEDKDPEEIKETKEPNEPKEIKAPKDPEATKEQKEVSTKPSKEENNEEKEGKLEKAAIAPPVQKPTPSPTWSFEVSSSQIVEDAVVECEYCQEKGCGFVDDDTDVVFSEGSTATCYEIGIRVQSLKTHQCDIERTAIEDTCCDCNISSESSEEEVPITAITGRMADVSLSGSAPCEFCVGQKFVDGAIITFSTGNGRVSCGGFMNLVRSGLSQTSPDLCSNERAAIEQACCLPLSALDGEEEQKQEVETPVVVVSSPVDSRLEDSVDDKAEESTPAVALVSSESTPASRVEETRSGCNFCNSGDEYLDEPIIYFSSGNDSVSCAGLMDLVRSGLYPSFCDNERSFIEQACCFEIQPTESPTSPPTNSPTNPPTNRPTPSPTNKPTTVPPTNSPTNSPTELPAPVTEPPVVVIESSAVFSVSLTTPPSIPEEDFDIDFDDDDDDFFFGNSTGNITEAEGEKVSSIIDEETLSIFVEENGEPARQEDSSEDFKEEAENKRPEKPGKPGKPGRPSTIAEGGKRENGPMANVDHKRERPVPAAASEKNKKLGQSAMGLAVDSREVDSVEDQPGSRMGESAMGGAVDSREVDPVEEQTGGRLGESTMGAAVDSREVDPVEAEPDKKKTGLLKKSNQIEPAVNGANTRSWGARRFMGIYRGIGSN